MQTSLDKFLTPVPSKAFRDIEETNINEALTDEAFDKKINGYEVDDPLTLSPSSPTTRSTPVCTRCGLWSLVVY